MDVVLSGGKGHGYQATIPHDTKRFYFHQPGSCTEYVPLVIDGITLPVFVPEVFITYDFNTDEPF